MGGATIDPGDLGAPTSMTGGISWRILRLFASGPSELSSQAIEADVAHRTYRREARHESRRCTCIARLGRSTEEEGLGVSVQPGVADVLGKVEGLGLAEGSFEGEDRIVACEQDPILAASAHEVQQRLRQVLG